MAADRIAFGVLVVLLSSGHIGCRDGVTQALVRVRTALTPEQMDHFDVLVSGRRGPEESGLRGPFPNDGSGEWTFGIVPVESDELEGRVEVRVRGWRHTDQVVQAVAGFDRFVEHDTIEVDVSLDLREGPTDGGVDVDAGNVNNAPADGGVSDGGIDPRLAPWFRSVIAGDDVIITDVATDPSGMILLAGQASGPSQIGSSTVTFGVDDSFVSSLSPRGKPQWTVRFGGAGQQIVTDVQIADDESIWVLGHASGNLQIIGRGIRPTPIPLPNLQSFLVVLGRDGSITSTKVFGTPAPDSAFGLAVTDTHVFVTGQTTPPLWVDGCTANAPTASMPDLDTYVLALDRDMNALDCVWATMFGGPGVDDGYAIVAASDRVFVTGRYTNVFEHESGSALEVAASTEGFIVSLDIDSGAPLGLKSFGGDGPDEGLALVQTAGEGDVFVTGRIRSDAFRFGSRVITTVPQIVIGFSVDATSLEFQRALTVPRVSGVPGSVEIRAAALTATGDVLLAGSYAPPIDFGSFGVRTPVGTDDMLILRYRPTIGIVGLHTTGSDGSDRATSVAWHSQMQRVVAGGMHRGDVMFPPDMTVRGGIRDQGVVVLFDVQ